MVRVPDAKSDCSRRGEAEVRILNFKTTWSEFQMTSQTATEQGEAKLRILEFANSPKSLSPSPPQYSTIFGEFLPKIPQSFNSPHPQLFPKGILEPFRGIPKFPQTLLSALFKTL